MRTLFGLIFLVLTISCNNNSLHNNEVNDTIININTDVKKYSESSLVEEKFQEFYDLNVMLKIYPKFNSDITLRLNKMRWKPDDLLNINVNLKVENVRLKKGLIKVSDSVYKTKLFYDVVLKNKIKTDSIFAFITKKTMLLDSQEIRTTKVQFSRK